MQERRKQTLVFQSAPSIIQTSAVGGKKEAQGPLAKYFDYQSQDTKFGQKSWEKAESRMQTIAMETTWQKAHLQPADIDLIFAGDLLNQCISTTFSVRDTGIPLVG